MFSALKITSWLLSQLNQLTRIAELTWQDCYSQAGCHLNSGHQNHQSNGWIKVMYTLKKFQRLIEAGDKIIE